MDQKLAQIICNLVDLQFEVNQLVKALPVSSRSGKVAHVLHRVVVGLERVLEGSREDQIDMGRGSELQLTGESKSHTPTPPRPGTGSSLSARWSGRFNRKREEALVDNAIGYGWAMASKLKNNS